MNDEFRVRVRKTGDIRTVTRQAYMAMGPKVYEKISDIDATVAPESPIGQVHRSVSAPVIRPQIVNQEQAPEPEQAEVPQAEQEAAEVQSEGSQPKRRGRKPGVKNQISSNSTEDEK